MLRLLIRSQLRFFVASKLSAVTVVLGITLGVASVVAVHLIGERITRQLSAIAPAHLQTSQFTARQTASADMPPTGVSASDYFALRSRWRQQQLPSVVQMYPVVQGVVRARVLGNEPEASQVTLDLVGLDWLQLLGQPLAQPLSLTGASAGSGLSLLSMVEPYPALVDTSLGWSLGHQFRVGGLLLQVAGQVAAQAPSSAGSLAKVYTDIGIAQLALGWPAEQLSLVAIAANDPGYQLRQQLEQLMPGISAGLPQLEASAVAQAMGPGWVLQGVTDGLPQVSFGRSVLFNLGALGTLSLVVAWFLIYQTAVLWLRRQAQVYQRLTYQGVTLNQLRWVFCLSIALVGLLAGLLGLGLGFGLAHWFVQQTAFASDGAVVALTFPVLLKALVSATLVSLLAAQIAFARLWRQPLAGRPWHWLTLLVYALGLLLGLQAGSLLPGAFLAIACLCLLVLALILPMLQMLRRAAAKIVGPLVWRMGVRELAWYPADVSVALGALVLAIATSIGVAAMVDSFRLDFGRMLQQRLAADVQVRGPTASVAELQQQLLSHIASPAASMGDKPLAVVQQVRAVRQATLPLQGQPVDVYQTTLDEAGAARYGLARAVNESEVVINERLARRLRLQLGDALHLQSQEVRVAGIYPGYGDTQGQIVAPTTLPLQLVEQSRQLQIHTPDPAVLVMQLRMRFPELQIQSRRSLRETALRVFDETFAITRALTFTALAVAAVGLYNALVALALLQQRSWLLLSVMGMRVSERLGFALARSSLILLITLLLAVPLGLGMGWLLCELVNPRAFGWTVPFTLSPSSVGLPLVLATVVSVLAGVLTLPMRERQVLI